MSSPIIIKALVAMEAAPLTIREAAFVEILKSNDHQQFILVKGLLGPILGRVQQYTYLVNLDNKNLKYRADLEMQVAQYEHYKRLYIRYIMNIIASPAFKT